MSLKDGCASLHSLSSRVSILSNKKASKNRKKKKMKREKNLMAIGWSFSCTGGHFLIVGKGLLSWFYLARHNFSGFLLVENQITPFPIIHPDCRMPKQLDKVEGNHLMPDGQENFLTGSKRMNPLICCCIRCSPKCYPYASPSPPPFLSATKRDLLLPLPPHRQLHRMLGSQLSEDHASASIGLKGLFCITTSIVHLHRRVIYLHLSSFCFLCLSLLQLEPEVTFSSSN